MQARRRKQVTEDCKKIGICPWCQALNGQVKKVPGAQSFKIVHDRYKTRGESTVMAHDMFESTMV